MGIPLIIISIDLEDWFHGIGLPEERHQIHRDASWLLEQFAAFDVRATFFVLGQVAASQPQLIRDIAAAGHEIAFHGNEHKFLEHVGPVQFARDLRECVPHLEDLTGQQIAGFRAPFFSITPRTVWALEQLAIAGFRYDASIYPGYNDRYGWPGAPRLPVRYRDTSLLIFPVPLLAPWLPVAFSGGAYLRMLPWTLVKWGLERTVRQGETGMVYIHPWETTDSLPRSPDEPWRARLTRYPGRKHMRRRFIRILSDWKSQLGTMGDALQGLAPPRWEPGLLRPTQTQSILTSSAHASPLIPPGKPAP